MHDLSHGGRNNIPRRVWNVRVPTEPNSWQKSSANEPFGTPFSLVLGVPYDHQIYLKEVASLLSWIGREITHWADRTNWQTCLFIYISQN